MTDKDDNTNEPEQIAGHSFAEIIQETMRRAEQAQKRYVETGGQCIQCGERPGATDTLICATCQEAEDKMVAELTSLGGFTKLEL